MFTQSARFYDLIYGGFKDYISESAQIAEILHSVAPGCRTVLDIACGTGEHAHLLAVNHGFITDGLDLDPALVRIAQEKHPKGRFVVANMTDFHIPNRYDAITCLFSSIGYLLTLGRVIQALNCFREHLAQEPGHISRQTSEGQGVVVERVAQTKIMGRISQIRFDYRISDADGVREVSEVHELGLFTTDELLEAFKSSGLSAEYDGRGITGRGLYLAKVAS
jgi:SAM-dependent methyltransferase